ncbi:putative carboxylesterase, 2-hydroxyisoflavanone dehydratase [Rosa chinensis]|uniref:Putative carboxylesterase, 2-hydroxyisoflavanone dehydratase n=1 Tax=Rosa chinensis TaxID=74649 RepID=A0A2P6QX20_ROSCH|nr:2-hydroxyisoflavanone dehydratase [Rosa chinensis]PRQ38704.1 putative carboxylesterase, 2-hydroxyisoflavanone dehydratase [Rosa chinensis]
MMSNASSFLGISTKTIRAPIHYPILEKLLSVFSNGFHYQRNRLRVPSSYHSLQRSQSHGLTICDPISSNPRNKFLLQTHHQCSRSETIDSVPKEIDTELLPFLRIYKDGSVERLMGSPYVPPTLDDPDSGVSSNDITISQNPLISARLFLPKLNEPHKKIPILVYYHGGAFCVESAFSFDHHRFLNSLVSQAKVVAVSVEYRMAPEHSLPIAYDDSWAALNWVALHFADNGINEEPWLISHGDPNRLFLGGDSAGANIAHNVAMRVGKEGLPNGINLLGVFLTHPFFWGSKPIEGDPCEEPEKDLACLVWDMAYPSAPGGIDNPMINPVAPEAPSLAGLGCSRVLVSVSENDELRHRGVGYYEAVKRSGFEGEAELVEVEGEDHAFHILKFETRNAKELTKKLADFLLK